MADNEKIEKMVEKATSDYLIQPDWDTNLQIIDVINQEPRKAADVIRVIQKRLKNSKSRIQFYAIELLEAVVKNCPSSHPIVGSKDFQDDLIKLATKKLKDNLKEKLLDAIQYWADSFQRRGDLQGFSRTYMELKRQNIQFPPRRKEPPLTFAAPVTQPVVVPVVPVVVPSYNPYPAYYNPTVPSPYPTAAANPPVAQSPPTATPFSTANKEHVVQSVGVLSEMLSFMTVEDPSQDPTTDEVIQEMLNTCKGALPQIRTLLETGQVSDLQLAEMIALNDDLTRTIANYDDIVAKKKAFKESGYKPEPTQNKPQISKPYSPPIKPPTNDLLGDLESLFTKTTIDSNPGVTVTTTSPAYNLYPTTSTSPPFNNNPAPVPVSNANNANLFDEFDMLATRHSTVSPTSSLTKGTFPAPPTAPNSLYGVAPTPSLPNSNTLYPNTLYPNPNPNPNTSSYPGLSATPSNPYGSGTFAPPPYSPNSVNSYNTVSTYPSISQPQPAGISPSNPPNMYPNPSLYPTNVNSSVYPSAPSTSPTYNNSANPSLSYASYSSPPNTYNYNYNPPK